MKMKSRSSLRFALVLPVTAGVCFCSAAPAMRLASPAASGLRASSGAGLSGKLTQGYLGVDVRDVSDDQGASLKRKDARGAEIVHVDHDGPAGKLGLQKCDVILEMNGQKIEGQEQFRRMLRETPAGRSVTLVISRDGQQQTMTTQLADREEVERRAWEQHLVVPGPGSDPGFNSARPPHAGNGFLHADPLSGLGARARRDLLRPPAVLNPSFTGAQLEVMGPQLGEFFGVEGTAGLLVRSVEVNSPAADAGLRAGDVVVRINRIAVADGNAWSKTIHQNKGKPVQLVVLRDRREQTMTLVPDTKKRSSVAWPVTDGKQSLVAEL